MLKPHHIERLRSLSSTKPSVTKVTLNYINHASRIARQHPRHLTNTTMNWDRMLLNGMATRGRLNI